MKTVIENHSELDNSIKEVSEFAKRNSFETTKVYVSLYHADILIGKGSSHIWYKSKKDINTRLAITYIK